MEKDVLVLTLRRSYNPNTNITHLNLDKKTAPLYQSRTGKYYYSSSKQLDYDGKPYLSLSYPMGGVRAYGIDYPEKKMLTVISEAFEKPLKNRISYLVGRLNTSNPINREKVEAGLHKAVAELNSYKVALKQFKEENNLA